MVKWFKGALETYHRVFQAQSSYPSDAIRALEGIFHYFDALKRPFYHVYGISIYESQASSASKSEAFAAGLRWVDTIGGVRRAGFPSWSRAGWSSAVRYFSYSDEVISLDMCDLSRITIRVKDSKGNYIDFDKYSNRSLSNSDTQLLTKFIYIEAYTIPIIITRLPQDSTLRVGNSPSEDIIDKSLSGFCAIFEDFEQRLVVPLYPNSSSFSRGDPSKSCAEPEFSNVVGLVLGRHQSKSSPKFGGAIFVLLVQEVSSHFERVGHKILNTQVM